MTTIISLAARDFIVIGCDSLATSSMDLLFPGQIANDFFDTGGHLKLGADGKPLLQELRQIWEHATSMPVNQLPSVTKIYDLNPAKAGLLFAGTSRIGEHTIKNIVETFKADPSFQSIIHDQNGTVEQLANALKDFISNLYNTEIPKEIERPTMEILLSGYSNQYREPEVFRLMFLYNRGINKFESQAKAETSRKQYNVMFGGQYDVIQRVVNGVDFPSWQGLKSRTVEVLEEWHKEIVSQLQQSGYGGPVPKPDLVDPRYDLFSKNWGNVSRIFSDVGSLSEQAGIDFVHFLISVMIKAQEFSNSIPTVGGKIHIAILTKSDGFRWISKEGFIFENQHVPKF